MKIISAEFVCDHGLHDIDGIPGTGVPNTYAAILTVPGYWQDSPRKKFLLRMSPTTNHYRGYSHRRITDEEWELPRIVEIDFSRPRVEGESTDYEANVPLLCVVEDGLPGRPIGRLVGHEIRLFGQDPIEPGWKSGEAP